MLFSTLISDTSFQDRINDYIEKIQSPRVGVKEMKLSMIENPFFIGELKEQNKDIEIVEKCNPFNIKTASKQEFAKIEHIDKFTAQKIIEYREEFSLNRTSDLLKVYGMIPLKFSSIDHYIKKSRLCLIKKVEETEEISENEPIIQREVIPDLNLQVIFNRKAKISDRWYGIGDSVRNYILIRVESDTVYMQDGKQEKILKLSKPKKSKNIIFSQ